MAIASAHNWRSRQDFVQAEVCTSNLGTLYVFEFGGVFGVFGFVYLDVLGECLFYSGKAAAGSDQGKLSRDWQFVKLPVSTSFRIIIIILVHFPNGE